MWKIVAVVTILVSPLAPPTSTHYVSCIDGHIVETLADCPPLPKHNGPDRPPVGGGGGGGLLGGLLGGIL